jgi:hypothetical protein
MKTSIVDRSNFQGRGHWESEQNTFLPMSPFALILQYLSVPKNELRYKLFTFEGSILLLHLSAFWFFRLYPNPNLLFETKISNAGSLGHDFKQSRYSSLKRGS